MYTAKETLRKMTAVLATGFLACTYAAEVTETFNTSSSAATNGWTGSGNTGGGNYYGWANTNVVLGAGTAGAAGGVFTRSASFSHYADMAIGTLSRTNTLRLAGSFRLANVNFDGQFFLGYFTPGLGSTNFVGLQLNEPSVVAGNPFRGFVAVNGTGGAGSGIISLPQNTTFSFDLNWTGNADGSGTLSGTVAGTNVTVIAGAGSASFTAFGLLNGGLGSSAAQKTAGCYFDSLTYTQAAASYTNTAPFKLLFSRQQDIVDPWGEVNIAVTPLGWLSTNVLESAMNSASSNRWLIGCFPYANGAWEVYSQQYEKLSTTWPGTSRWSLLRGITTNGVTFTNVETVIPAVEGTWTSHQTIAYNPDAGEYMMLKMDTDPRGTAPNDSNGFVYHAWFSSDGRQWQKYSGTRPRGGLFYEADAMSLFWSPVLKRYVLVSKSLQPWQKHIPDHGRVTPEGIDRRVLMIRTSPDGRTWTPDGDLKNIFGLNPPSPDDYHPPEWYTLPDAEDPPDLELYSGSAFWYHDRAYMSVLNYTPSPMRPNQHGEHPDYEWWTSVDGLSWERPARGVQANRALEVGRRDLGPLIIGGKLMWLYWNYQAGMPEDRISGVCARANGEFSTRLFTMPDRDLRLNAMVPSPDRPWVRRSPQPYLMVEVRNAQGGVIPGFERSKCVIWDGTTSPTRNTQVDTTDHLLTWNGVSARQLSDQNIQLRFSFGGSTIYAVTAAKDSN